ncbi:MAG: hypothetical protein Homavirus30_4 [Homavirus sp.]|uniref:Uncharacterized protein n=1 Tax=Homavirus sp. TaxID=2487769 RepID=A0A3G5A5M1_9VIRU|nr:MAG: hypothetical protein Homavirus30_4 [Homavirus sp.]
MAASRKYHIITLTGSSLYELDSGIVAFFVPENPTNHEVYYYMRGFGYIYYQINNNGVRVLDNDEPFIFQPHGTIVQLVEKKIVTECYTHKFIFFSNGFFIDVPLLGINPISGQGLRMAIEEYDRVNNSSYAKYHLVEITRVCHNQDATDDYHIIQDRHKVDLRHELMLVNDEELQKLLKLNHFILYPDDMGDMVEKSRQTAIVQIKAALRENLRKLENVHLERDQLKKQGLPTDSVEQGVSIDPVDTRIDKLYTKYQDLKTKFLDLIKIKKSSKAEKMRMKLFDIRIHSYGSVHIVPERPELPPPHLSSESVLQASTM